MIAVLLFQIVYRRILNVLWLCQYVKRISNICILHLQFKARWFAFYCMLLNQFLVLPFQTIVWRTEKIKFRKYQLEWNTMEYIVYTWYVFVSNSQNLVCFTSI